MSIETRINRKSRNIFYSLILIIILFFLNSNLTSALTNERTAVIYYNIACDGCSDYISSVEKILNQHNILNVVKKDYINEKSYRKELNNYKERIGAPPRLQGHITIIIDDRIILEGHIPEHIIKDLLTEEKQEIFSKIIVYQDEMHNNAKSYKIWAFKGDIKEYKIDTPVSEYLRWFNSKKDSLKNPNQDNSLFNLGSLFFIVVFTGLFAGIHPCTIAVLLFFLVFLFTIRRSRLNIFKVGISYIIGIFIAYFLIGLGILKAVSFSNPHFTAIIAAYLIIGLGIINIINYFFKNRLSWINFGIPKSTKKTILSLIHRTSVPAAFIIGLIVGVCSFGCTAGIYFSILGLLIKNAITGIFYLVLYNLMFIIPLILILLIASNKKIVEKIESLEKSEKKYIKFVSGLIMIALGLFILYGGVLH